jgi:type II secretion system protein N
MEQPTKKSLFKIVKTFLWLFFVSVFSALVILFFIFPFGDLGDLVSAKVSEFTLKQIFLQFEDLNLGLFPTPSVELKDVYVEVVTFSGLKINDLKLTPSLFSMISKKPYGLLEAEGLFLGSLKVSVKKGPPTETGEERHKLELEGSQLALKELNNFAHLSSSTPDMSGQVNIQLQAIGSPEMSEQPEIDTTIDISKFIFPPATIDTPMGPLTLPDFKLDQIHLKGRLIGGKLIIEKGQIGIDTDEVFGTLKGTWNITFEKQRPTQPVLGAYNLEVDLTTTQSFQSKAVLFLSLIDPYKKAVPKGANYRFKASGLDLLGPPNLSAL